MIIHELVSREWPDTGELCCMGVAVNGPGGCTCWEPVYDIDIQVPHDGTMPVEATSMCHDCAYRKNSPERTGAVGYAGDEEELEHIVLTGKKFYCHQGVRKVTHYRHPSGMVIEAHPADYAWKIVKQNGEEFPIKADGSPVEICGGWCKMRKKIQEAP